MEMIQSGWVGGQNSHSYLQNWNTDLSFFSVFFIRYFSVFGILTLVLVSVFWNTSVFGIGIGYRPRTRVVYDPGCSSSPLPMDIIALQQNQCFRATNSKFQVWRPKIGTAQLPVEYSDSEKIFRFDSIYRNELIFSIRFDSASLPYRRIGYYRLLCCQMSTLLRHHESLSQLHKDVGCDVSYNNWAEHCTLAYIK